MNILLKKITFGINIFSPESGRKNTCYSVIFKSLCHNLNRKMKTYILYTTV